MADEIKPIGHISEYGLEKLKTRRHYCVSVSHQAEKEYTIGIVTLSSAQSLLAERTKQRDEWKDMATELKGLVEEWKARAEAAEALLKEAREKALQEGFLCGFMASGEGYNGEYPFDEDADYLRDPWWIEMRDRKLRALKEKP